MAKSDRILLVEGDTDQRFFIEVLKHLGLDAKVTVAPPKTLGGTHNNKEGTFKHLPVLLEQLGDGRISRLALIVDADYQANGGGYQRAISRVTAIVEPYRFVFGSRRGSGVAFRNTDGLADFGFWVMPNNENEGGLEDWFSNCVHHKSQELFAHAKATVAKLPQPYKFKPTHLSKAEISTWLAWEKSPGHGFQRALDDELIEVDCAPFKNLCAWLTHIYT